jgi:hypothetical protein
MSSTELSSEKVTAINLPITNGTATISGSEAVLLCEFLQLVTDAAQTPKH